MKILKDNNVEDLSGLSHEELESRYCELSVKYAEAEAKIRFYEEQYRLSQSNRFGRSSERMVDGQLGIEDFNIFNEAEQVRDPFTKELKEDDVIASNGAHKGRKKNTGALPVVTDTFELDEDKKICPRCGSTLHEVKKITTVQIEVIPAKTFVHKYEAMQYACRRCDENGESSFVTAPGAPKHPISGSIAGASLIADIISKKFVDATPFYRQEENNLRKNIPITRANMCNWTISVANTYFKTLERRLREIQYSEHVIHCDETYVEVLKEDGRRPERKSYIWVTTTPEYKKEHPIALYRYMPTRSAEDARKVLKGYQGYIICDGYPGYDALLKRGKDGSSPMNVTLVCCLAHLRRKFTDALKVTVPGLRMHSSAETAIKKIRYIFDLDKQLKELSPEERKKERRNRLKPAMDSFYAWLEDESAITLPRCKYGEAVNYALSQKDKVYNVFLDGRLDIDNNIAERAVKPFVIGRKNWLFSDTVQGAEASSILYGIIETAKRNNLIPYEYIKWCLERMPEIEEPLCDIIDRFLPWSDEIPDYVKNPQTTDDTEIC